MIHYVCMKLIYHFVVTSTTKIVEHAAFKANGKPLHSKKERFVAYHGLEMLLEILKMSLADPLPSIQDTISLSGAQINILLSFF